MIETIQQFAKRRNITVSGAAQLKRIDIQALPLYAKVGNQYFPVKDKNGDPLTQKFIIENKS